MTIYRVQHKKNYTVVNNFICKDRRLSWKAKGIWLYAFSRPDDWQFNLTDLINQSTDGRESVTSGLKELEALGYLQREQRRDNGAFSKAEWVFHETPEELKKTVPQTGFPSTAMPDAENKPLLSTERKPSTERKQQQAAAVFLPSSKIEKDITFYPALLTVNIPTYDKEEITRNYEEADVNYAVFWATHPLTVLNKGLAAAIKWACKVKPEMPQSEEDRIRKNKAYAKKYNGLRHGSDKIDSLNTYVVINVQGAMESPSFKYDTPKFMDKFKKALQKRGYVILEET